MYLRYIYDTIQGELKREIYPGGIILNKSVNESAIKEKFSAIGRCLFYCFCYIALQGVFSLIIGAAAGAAYGGALYAQGSSVDEIGNRVRELLLNHMSYIFLIVNPLVLIFFLTVFGRSRRTFLHKSDFSGLNAGVAALAVLAAVLFNIFMSVFLPFLNLPSNTSALLDSMQRNDVAVSFLALAVITPVLEEIVFRGYIFNRLRRSFKSIAAVILIQALLFGAEHLDVEQSFYAFFLGVVMGVVYYKTGRLAYTIILHMAFNACSFALGAVPGLDNITDAGAYIISAASLALFAVTFLALYRKMRAAGKRAPELVSEAVPAEAVLAQTAPETNDGEIY